MGYITNRTRIEPTIHIKKKLLVLTGCGVMCLTLTLLTIVVDPLAVIIGHYSRIANGSYVHDLIKREIYGVHLSAYLFNVTNPEEFLSGRDQKLRVEEVGPFTYEEVRVNENIEIDTNAEVLRYTPRIRPRFLQEESVGRPEDFNITMPNLALLSIASKVSGFSYLPRMGFNLLTYKYQSKAFVSMSASDYLWGYDEPLIKLGNNILPEIINFDTLGILDRLYDKKTRLNIELSTKEKDRFVIKSVNGVKGMKNWNYEDPDKRSPCNSFHNVYEGIAYPPDLTPERPLKIYRNILCRFLDLEFVERRPMEYGVEGWFYKLSNKTFGINNNTECLCSRGVCSEGISDLAPCFYELPVVLSNAHFLEADPKIYERVDGMVPKEEEHGSGFTINPKTGIVLTTQFAVQLNILVQDVKFNLEASKFSNMLVPVAYFKIIQPPITSEQVFNLRFVYIYGPYSILFIQIALGFAGLFLLAYAARILYGNWSYSSNPLRFHVRVKQKTGAEERLMR